MDAPAISSGGPACRRVRERLCEMGPGPRAAIARAGLADAAVTEHLAGCAGCAAFARRLELARAALGAPPAGPTLPDAQFAARVVARLARPPELIGWAALRALPAALGLALVLAWLGWSSPVAAPPSPLLESAPPSSDQLLAWASLSPEVWP